MKLVLRRDLRFKSPKLETMGGEPLWVWRHYEQRRGNAYTLTAYITDKPGCEARVDYFFDACYCLDRLD